MSQLPACPECSSPYTYEDQAMLVCPECGHEWSPESSEAPQVKDANGTVLQDGDTVTVIKDLKVKGSSTPLKIGTKIKNIRLNDRPDHQIDCKIPGFGAMGVTAEYVKKLS